MKAHNLATRQKAYSMWKEGLKKSVIARELQMDYDTLVDWCHRFKTEGELGLRTRYERCGLKSDLDDPIRIRALEMRKQNSTWGGDYIRVQLVKEFAESEVVKPNQIRKWLHAAGLMPKKTSLPKPKAEWVQRPLQRVQVDANEQLKTEDGKVCCYLNFTDEHSGAVLDAFVFPPQPDQSGPSE